MRAKMLLFALLVLGAMLALGQNQVQLEPFGMLLGLPDFGVTLSGTPANPVVENHANQAIIGHVLRVFYANGAVPVNFANFKAREIWQGRSEGIKPNETESPLNRPASPQLRVGGVYMNTSNKVVLDSVVFANGQMVGPDVVQNFPMLTEQVSAMRELATFALEAQQNVSLQPVLWSELERIVSGLHLGLSEHDRPKLALAFDLRSAHAHNKDEEVFAMARRLLAIPTPWRTK